MLFEQGGIGKKTTGCIWREITYQSFEELLDVLEQTGTRDFARAIGYNGSLGYCIEQCKSAIGYPGHGIPILLCGENGVGKKFPGTAHVRVMRSTETVVPKEEEVVWMNCSDYQNKPEKFRETAGCAAGKKAVWSLKNLDRLPPEETGAVASTFDRRTGRAGKAAGNSRPLKKQKEKFWIPFCVQIPIVLQIPSLDERSPEEREELIVSCFHKESLKLHKDIYISKRVLQAFMKLSF